MNCATAGFTPETADHNQQISEVGFDAGGPIIKDKLFFWGSIATQDIRLYRQAARGTDRTVLKTYNAKVNWQATSKDMVNFLFFNGDKIKEGRAPGNALIEPTSARWNQSNYYTDTPLHGLWKWEDNRVMTSNWFLSAEVRVLQHRFHSELHRRQYRADGDQPVARSDIRVDQRQLQCAAAAHRQHRQQLLQDDGGDDARLQVRLWLAAQRHLLADALPWQWCSRVRELGYGFPRTSLSRGRRHQPRGVPELLCR